MTAILITRHYSGFANVADHYTVGDNEADGNASVSHWRLPAGYVMHAYGFICDPAGYRCEIVPHTSTGRPVLMSLAGTQPDAHLEAA